MIMTTVERIIFIRAPYTANGGATVRVCGVTGGDHVEVQVTHCSQNTPFSRKEGRKFVLEKEVVKMKVGDLPKKLKRITKAVLRKAHAMPGQQHHDMDGAKLLGRDWAFTMQWFQTKAEPKQEEHHPLMSEALEQASQQQDEESGVKPSGSATINTEAVHRQPDEAMYFLIGN